MDLKKHFIAELKSTYRTRIAAAARAEAEASGEANPKETDSRRRDEAKETALQSRLASGHRRRRKQAVAEMERLLAFAEGGMRGFRSSDGVGVGALVDVRVEDEDGEDERTLFLLPVGAGVELPGPGGDGFITVITPGSPVGKALSGAHVDDCFEIVVHGRDREWTVVDIS